MGVDANLYAVGEVSDERLAEAEAFMQERVGDRMTWDPHRRLLERVKYEDNWVEVNTPSRYYGPGYERGPWPDIFATIVALKVALPECVVFYGGDTTDTGIEATDEYLWELWAHWLGPDGLAYRSFMRAHTSGVASPVDEESKP